jgi:hypothetical protein
VADLRTAAGELGRRHIDNLRTWFTTAQDWDPVWITASVTSITRLVLTPDELAALRDELAEVVERHAARVEGRDAPAGAARTEAQIHLFPKELLDEPAEGDDAGSAGVDRDDQ